MNRVDKHHMLLVSLEEEMHKGNGVRDTYLIL